MSKPIPLALRGLRFFYRFLSPLMPTLGVKLMWQVFRPRRRPRREEHQQFLATAERFTFDHTSPITGKTSQLQGYRWGSGPRTVLLMHGWEGSAADFRELVPTLVARGWAVTSFDLPAHGGSEGQETNLVEMKQALADCMRHAGPPQALVAHSLGGTAAALLLADAETREIERLVLVASPLSAQAAFEVGFAPLAVPPAVLRRFYQRLAGYLRQPVENLVLPPATQLRARHVLAVYDPVDEQVPFGPLQAYLAANPRIEQLVLPGVGHTRLLRQASVVQRIAEFVASAAPVAPLGV